MYNDYPYYFEVETNLGKSILVYVKELGYNMLMLAFTDKNGEIQTARYEKNSIDVKVMISAFLQEYDIIVDSVSSPKENI